MRTYVNEIFHVEQLLVMGDLDIRAVAAQRRGLTADAFFTGVARFAENVPTFAAALQRLPLVGELEAMRTALTDIGCQRIVPELDAIGSAVASGAQALALERGLALCARLHTLQDRIKSAYIRKRSGASHTAQRIEKPDCGVLLSEALAYFDHREAHRKLRILAVDDVAVALNTITSILSPHYEVFALTKASLVEKFLTHTTPELFLLDIEMPDLHGYDLVSVIRGFAEHKETPIIFLTGNASVENLKTAVLLGACDFITKPVSPEILLEKIGSNIIRKKAF